MKSVTVKVPVVFCAVRDGLGRWLLVERVAPPEVGCWSIPGGHIEEGETYLEACVRELREETGLEVRPRYKGHLDVYIPAQRLIRRCFYCVSHEAQGTPRGSDEGQAGWFAPQEKPLSPFLKLLTPWLCGAELFKGLVLCDASGRITCSCIVAARGPEGLYSKL